MEGYTDCCGLSTGYEIMSYASNKVNLFDVCPICPDSLSKFVSPAGATILVTVPKYPMCNGLDDYP